MGRSLPILEAGRNIHLWEKTVTMGVTTIEDFLRTFPTAVEITWCSGQCHQEVHIPTDFGRCRIVFEPPDLTLRLFVADLTPPLTLLEAMSGYSNPGQRQEHIHLHTGQRHLYYTDLAVDLSLTNDGRVQHIGFGMSESKKTEA